jgi:hypothetical protein
MLAAVRMSPQPPTGEIRGTVVDELKSVPLHTPRIELRGEGIRRVVQAGASGYRIPGLPAAVYDLTITGSFLVPMTIRTVRLNAGEIRELPPVQMTSAIIGGCRRTPRFLRPLDNASRGSIGGTVVGAQNRPLGGARVLVGEAGTAVTDGEGRFLIDDLPARDRYGIEVAHDGYYTGHFSDFHAQGGYEAVYDAVSLQPCDTGRCVAALQPFRPEAGCLH